MQNILVLIFLILFGVCTLMTYLAVRRRWTHVLIATLLGILGDTLTIGWASLARGTWLPQAMLLGLALGLMFTGMTVSIGMFYRTNPPGQTPNPPRKPAVRPISSMYSPGSPASLASSASPSPEAPASSQPPSSTPSTPPRQPADENT